MTSSEIAEDDWDEASKIVLNSRQFPEYFGILGRPEVTGHNKKIPPLYLRKHLLATAGNLKVKEQSKYRSAPIFFISSYGDKARNMELLNF